MTARKATPTGPGPMVHVAGYCPMGCGTTLFVGVGGHITCSFVECPEPSAVSHLLADPDTDHTVEIETDGFAVRHPLRERLTAAGADHEGLFDCGLFSEIAAGDGPPVPPGRYRVPDDLDADGGLVFIPC